MEIKENIKTLIENAIIDFEKHGIDDKWLINKNNIHDYLIDPVFEEYVDPPGNKIMLWTVINDDEISYRIVYSEERGEFGLATITDKNEKLYLGIYGSFAETFSSM